MRFFKLANVNIKSPDDIGGIVGVKPPEKHFKDPKPKKPPNLKVDRKPSFMQAKEKGFGEI